MQQLTSDEYSHAVSMSLHSFSGLPAAVLTTSQHVFRPHCACDGGVAHALMDCADVLDATQRLGADRMAEGIGRGWCDGSRR
jgi:hypothetical protein